MKWKRIADVVAAVILAAAIAELSTDNPRHFERPTATRWSDYDLNLYMSIEVEVFGNYPEDFVYPPPSVVLRLLFAELGYEPGGWCWSIMQAVVAFSCFPLLFRLTGIEKHQGRWLAALAVFGVVHWPMTYDLRCLNCNSLSLFVVLAGMLLVQRNRKIIGGYLIGLSAALKLYSIVFLPYYVVRRRWRTLLGALTGLLVAFVLVPAWWFGPTQTLSITQSWLETTQGTSREGFSEEFQAYLISTPRTLHALRPNWSEAEVQKVARTIQIGWLVVCGAILALRSRAGESDGVVDGCVLLLMPLPLSPLLQPHHLVVLLAPLMVVAARFLTKSVGGVRGGLVLGLIAVGWLTMELGPAAERRGVSAFVFMTSTLLALAFATHPVVPRNEPRRLEDQPALE